MIDNSDWPLIVGAMRTGGYFGRVMDAGPELDRVKQYLRAFAGEAPVRVADPAVSPTYPCFPGLDHRRYHDPAGCAGAAMLEAAFPAIRDEATALGDAAQLDYTVASRPWRSWHNPLTWLRRRAAPRAWTVYPFYHMGVDVEALTRRCPQTFAAVRALPRVCLDYPWGDALFSVQGARSRLPPHCSVDNLRLRCHLGVRIPAGTGIRVGGEEREWREGRCVLFEDGFEHSVWNDFRRAADRADRGFLASRPDRDRGAGADGGVPQVRGAADIHAQADQPDRFARLVCAAHGGGARCTGPGALDQGVLAGVMRRPLSAGGRNRYLRLPGLRG